MKHRIVIPILLAVILVAAWPRSQTATAVLQDGVSVSMTIRPMLGWHSDWHRRLTFTTPHFARRTDLLDDTGWWRGSNLYLHLSGHYILHEGQAGCIVLDATGSDSVDTSEISCERSSRATEDALGDAAGGSVQFEPSRLYDDFLYIGHFGETRGDGPSIRFMPAKDLPERELPDPL